MTKRSKQKSIAAPARNESQPQAVGAAVTESQDGDSEPVTKRIAKHDLLDKAGAPLADDLGEESAWGMRYTLLANSQAFDYQYGANADADRMLAVFGAKTLATNESSQARNNLKGAGSADEQIQAVRDRFALIAGGTWLDRTREGPKVNMDAMAEAVVQEQIATGAKRKDGTLITQDLADSGYKAEVRQKLDDDPTFLRNARQVPGIANRYATIVGRAVRTVADLAI